MEKWYVIQTRVNDEEKLVELINKMVLNIRYNPVFDSCEKVKVSQPA